jgi:hypothetical protein
VAAALRRCAGWHGCPLVRVERTEPADVADVLRVALDAVPNAEAA